MPQLIQAPPLGLLALLNSKAGGQNPNALADTVQPTVELNDLYELNGLASRDVLITAATITAGVGTFIQPTGFQNRPLDNEIWRLRAVSIHGASAPAAGTAMILSPAIFDIRGGDSALLGTSPRFAGVAQNFGFGVNCDLFLRPQFSVGFYVNEAATPTDVRLTCLFASYQPV